MSDPIFCVHIIDDDTQILKALSRVLRVSGYAVESFESAESFFDHHDPEIPGCVIIDINLPGKDGFDIQEEMERCGRPVIFLTGQGSVTDSIRAMKAGALDFLEKPVDSSVLVAAVCEAKGVDASRRQMLAGKKYFEERMSSLTRRERQVLDHVFLGRLNKQIAGDLGTAEKTIKVHRRRMMKKMAVKTVADLVSLVQRYDPRPLP